MVLGATEGIGVANLARRMLNMSQEIGEDSGRMLVLVGDSSAAIAIVQKKGSNKKIRHVEVRAMFLQQLIRMSGVLVEKVHGTRNWSDMMTKHGKWSDEHYHFVGLSVEGNSNQSNSCEDVYEQTW